MKKIFIGTIIVVISVVSIYWIKGSIGINISESYTLSKYFPFKHFSGDMIAEPKPGEIIINESFYTKRRIIKKWEDLWMREEGKVTLNHDSQGINNSQCLFIRSRSERGWSYSNRTFIKVQKGDRFIFEGFAWIQGKDVSSTFSIASYDSEKKVIDRRYHVTKIYRNNQFERITNQFTVSDDIPFIRFRITGEGVGDFRFDDINLRKLDSHETTPPSTVNRNT